MDDIYVWGVDSIKLQPSLGAYNWISEARVLIGEEDHLFSGYGQTKKESLLQLEKQLRKVRRSLNGTLNGSAAPIRRQLHPLVYRREGERLAG